MKITDNKKAVGIVTAREDREDCYPALDYDNYKLVEVIEDVRMLIEIFKLGDCHIAKTSEKSYHAYFFYEMMNWQEVLNILKSSIRVDKKFLAMKEETGQLRMRIAGKGKNPPRIVDVVKSPYQNINESRGEVRKRHYEFLVKKLGRKHG